MARKAPATVQITISSLVCRAQAFSAFLPAVSCGTFFSRADPCHFPVSPEARVGLNNELYLEREDGMRWLLSAMVCVVLAGCAAGSSGPAQAGPVEVSPGRASSGPAAPVRPPGSAEAALEAYYETLPDSFYPRAPQGLSLPGAQATLTRVLVGSCFDEERPDSPVMRRLAEEEADLFLMIGDNVYGDVNAGSGVHNQATLDELRESFSQLAARPDFRAVRARHPMMVAWDDHDYGANDAGREFPFRRLAERIHEKFWGLDVQEPGTWPGTYHARVFGSEGRKLQVIVLDTRFFRSGLTPTDARGEPGRERYLPSSASDQDMLGDEQWRWLEQQLEVPADLRLIVSSIQVLPTDGHGWEAWSRLPDEQARLFGLIGRTGAGGVVFVSGDRHAAFLYRDEAVLPYPVFELTASSMNVSSGGLTAEMDPAQLGPGYRPENFGVIEVDWQARTVRLAILSDTGDTVQDVVFPIGNVPVR